MAQQQTCQHNPRKIHSATTEQITRRVQQKYKLYKLSSGYLIDFFCLWPLKMSLLELTVTEMSQIHAHPHALTLKKSLRPISWFQWEKQLHLAHKTVWAPAFQKKKSLSFQFSLKLPGRGLVLSTVGRDSTLSKSCGKKNSKNCNWNSTSIKSLLSAVVLKKNQMTIICGLEGLFILSCRDGHAACTIQI